MEASPVNRNAHGLGVGVPTGREEFWDRVRLGKRLTDGDTCESRER